ncbi:MAG: hypothetical protein PHN88_10970 [Ignavibacteria bacterium]|nr:hypothetical protein [Ignavibacteria bacterium]
MGLTKEVEEYYSTLDGWMRYYNMEPMGVEPNWLFDRAYKRTRIEAAKFGQANTFAFAKYSESPDVRTFETFSRECFNYAMSLPKSLPIGLGATLTVYPCFIVNRITKELSEFVKTYLNKHYSAFEFPGILDMFAKDLYYYPSTPVWGALYYRNFRKENYNLFSPKAWNEIVKPKNVKI